MQLLRTRSRLQRELGSHIMIWLDLLQLFLLGRIFVQSGSGPWWGAKGQEGGEEEREEEGKGRERYEVI